MTIASLVQDPDVLLELEPAEVGAVILEYLDSLPANEAHSLTHYNHLSPDTLREYPSEKRLATSKAFSEGWMWLLREGLIAPRPDDAGEQWYFVTRQGSALRTREHKTVSCAILLTMDPKQLLAEALQLPPEERAALAGELIQSLDSEVDDDAEAAWSAEIRRRIERLDAGLAKTVPWAEARRRILAAARRDSQA